MIRTRLLAALAILFAFAAPVHAQDYPNKLIKLMHGFPPGGQVDVVARIMAQELSKRLGQSIVVENKPGVGGGLVAQDVAKAEPDGHTLLIVPGSHSITTAIFKQLRYHPVDDFDWISSIAFYPYIVIVKKDSKYATLKDLLDAARAKSGAVTIGSPSVGSVQHMSAELMAQATGVKFVHVPYRGEAPAFNGLLSGDVDFIVSTTVAIPQVHSGQVRALAVTGTKRLKELPDVPTVAQAGVAGFDVTSWVALAAPARTPKPIIDRLNTEVRNVLAMPEIKSRIEGLGGDVAANTPADMRALVAQQAATWTKVVNDANIKPE
jgi:tripartite-type tricarboxylate transporter receptor subunit TctC